MDRIYNFSSGPAAINIEILKQAQRDMLNCMDSGMSVLEMNHKAGFFGDIMARTSELFRELLNLDDRYEILFINGGAYLQFSMVPMNLMRKFKRAVYVDTDDWTRYAAKEAEKFGDVCLITSNGSETCRRIPELDIKTTDRNADYLYLCTNNTYAGSAFRPRKIPALFNMPLVADMTSNFMSEVYDINKFGLIFAAAQKNLGPAGICVVIADKKAIGSADERIIPRAMCYKAYADTNSMFTTPSTFSVYLIMLTLEWIRKNGGVSGMAELNNEKASMLYDVIDNSKLYQNRVASEDRSIMNVVFTTGCETSDARFVKEAQEKGLYNLAGPETHKGLRAGIYNGVSREAVCALTEFMKEYEHKYKGV